MLADLARHVGQLRRKFAPAGILDNLLQRDFRMDAGQPGFVLPRAEEGNQQAALFRLKAENEIVPPGFRLHIRGEKGPEALLPVLDRRRGGGLAGVVGLAQFFLQAQGEGRHMAANAGEGVRAIALMLRGMIGYGEGQAGSIDLEVFSLDDSLHFPCVAFLDVDLLHPAFRQDVVGRVADIFRHVIMEKALAHFTHDALFRSAHSVPHGDVLRASKIARKHHL